MSYLPCELHCHTIHSDGSFSVRELQEAGHDGSLSLIALTDHNTFSGYGELDNAIIPTVRGIEWTTYFGHMLVLGAKKFVDWRNAVIDNIDDKINEVKACGGIVGIAHPYQLGSPICTGGRWEFNVKSFRNIDYIEIWHEDLSKLSEENIKSTELWTSLLDKGYRISASYGRDWHRIEKSGCFGCTYLDIDGTVNEAAAIRSIRMGKTVVSLGPKLFFRLHRFGETYSIGDTVKKGTYTFSFYTDLHSRENELKEIPIKFETIKIISNGGKTVLETRCDQRHSKLRLESGRWYRAELWGRICEEKRAIAVTSPVYCD